MSLMQEHHRGPQAASSAQLVGRFLIVARERLAGRRLARMLNGKGYEEVRAVSRAARALVVARQQEPSMVFLDVALPEDAYELARDLHRGAGLHALRVIALTHSIEHSTRERARSAGFERWLVTPVAQEDLDALLRDTSETA